MKCQAFCGLQVAAALVAIAACSRQSEQGTIEGTVTLDGTPLDNGMIHFAPLDGASRTADAIIATGKFSTQVPLGEKRVTITASKFVGKHKMYDAPGSAELDVVQERIPARYNAESKLSVTVNPGNQVADFNLEGR